jgi:hypothetical protein
MSKNVLQFDPGYDPKMEKSFLAYLAARYQEKVDHLTDPATGKPPKIAVVEGATLNKLQFRIEGSDEVIAQAREIISG